MVRGVTDALTADNEYRCIVHTTDSGETLMHIRPATLADAPAINAIYNDAVSSSTASFDLEPQSVESRAEWLTGRAPRHPVIIAEIEGTVVGWGALSPYSARAAYDRTVEISLYVATGHQCSGIGRAMALELHRIAAAEGAHNILARICTENTGSIALVRSLGFHDAGTMHEVGHKFGRWLDVTTWEYIPPEPGR